MSPMHEDPLQEATPLRTRAEELVCKRLGDGSAPSIDDVQNLVHELEVHRVELEMQNEHLREAQQELEASRDRYADLYDFSPTGYVSLDPKGVIRQINLTAALLVGRERATLVDRPFSVLVAADDRRLFRNHLVECIQGDGPVRAEVTLSIKGGGSVVVELCSIMMQSGHGRAATIRTTMTDVTERRRSEDALRELQRSTAQALALLDTLHETAPVGIGFVDRDFRFIRINEALAAMNGLPAAAHIGRPIRDVVPALWPRLEPVYQRALAGESVLDIEVSGETAARPGELRHWQASYYPVRVGSDEIMGVGVVVLEITEQKRAQQELRESQERHIALQTALLQASSEILAQRDMPGLLASIAEAARKLTAARVSVSDHGYSGGELTIGAASRSEDMPPCPEGMAFALNNSGLLRDGVEKAGSFRMTDEEMREHAQWKGLPPGHVPLRGLLAARLPVPEGAHMIVVSHKNEGDFTWEDEAALNQLAAVASLGIQHVEARTEADLRAREALERGAELARSNDDLEQFSYVVSHDLQEPLRAVTGFLELLQETQPVDEEGRRYIELAVDGAQRMRRLIESLLVYSRVHTSSEDMMVTDMNDVFREALTACEAGVEESGGRITHDPLPAVLGNGMLLARLFQNLIANAVKFRRPDVPLEIHVRGVTDGPQCLFYVRDNGIGIPETEAERIFEVFRRLHSRDKYAGTGIGLAICRKIVERHGGRIKVESEPGNGATFLFTLPAAAVT